MCVENNVFVMSYLPEWNLWFNLYDNALRTLRVYLSTKQHLWSHVLEMSQQNQRWGNHLKYPEENSCYTT